MINISMIKTMEENLKDLNVKYIDLQSEISVKQLELAKRAIQLFAERVNSEAPTTLRQSGNYNVSGIDISLKRGDIFELDAVNSILFVFCGSQSRTDPSTSIIAYDLNTKDRIYLHLDEIFGKEFMNDISEARWALWYKTFYQSYKQTFNLQLDKITNTDDSV